MASEALPSVGIRSSGTAALLLRFPAEFLLAFYICQPGAVVGRRTIDLISHCLDGCRGEIKVI